MGGYWTTNIGNSFYELGIMHVLNLIEEVKTIRTTNSQSIFWSMWNAPWVKSFDPFKVCDIDKIDYVAIAGPMMTPKYLNDLQYFFRKCTEHGKRILFISGGQQIQFRRG